MDIKQTLSTLKAIDKVVAVKPVEKVEIPEGWTQPEINFLSKSEVLASCAKLTQTEAAKGLGIPRPLWKMSFILNDGRTPSDKHMLLCYAMANQVNVATKLVESGIVAIDKAGRITI